MLASKTIRIGLAGNPNTGKTTLFNAITGAHQKTGNYAGVTVEKKEGKRSYKGYELIIYDLPGTYSLTAYSLDEIVARDFILEEKPDVIIDVLDSTNIERNLYLCLQFQELGIPIIGALNIEDQAESMGIRIDVDRLSHLLGIRMVKTVGTRGNGIEELLDAVIAVAENGIQLDRTISYGLELEAEVTRIFSLISQDTAYSKKIPARWLAIKLLEKDANADQLLDGHPQQEAIRNQVKKSINTIEAHFGNDTEIIVSEQRYAYIHGAAAESVERVVKNNRQLTETIDMVLMNRFLGLPIFLVILWAVFQITFVLGEYPMHWIETIISTGSNLLAGVIPDGLVKSLVIDGIIGGVGGVLSFVPLIVILFLCISILEDTGYMARAAFIMDKFLHLFGLHGQSFLPMMIGFGCSVPAIMAARTLKNPRDRIITILVTPFMNCGAKLPVHILLAGAFFPHNAGNMVMLIYIIGVVLALLSSVFLKKTVLRGQSTPFVMELPPYRMPTWRGITWHVVDKTGGYLKKAGTVLLAASILIWAIVSFPKQEIDEAKRTAIAEQYRVESLNTDEIRVHLTDVISGKISPDSFKDETKRVEMEQFIAAVSSGTQTIDEKVSEVATAETAAYVTNVLAEEALAYSIAGRVGKVIEPVVKPLGFDWKIAISAVTGFAAKEAVVSTLGVLFRVGSEATEDSNSLRESLKKDPVFNPLVAFILMLFTLIVPPCLAALSTIKAEIGWKWLGFSVVYLISLGWIICFSVYQIGKLAGLGG